MASVTHILDTSAILAHYFDEPGAAEVDAIWRIADPHMDGLPSDAVRQLRLPDKAR